VGAATNETQVICRSSLGSASVKSAWGIGRQMDLAPIGLRDKGSNVLNSFLPLHFVRLPQAPSLRSRAGEAPRRRRSVLQV